MSDGLRISVKANVDDAMNHLSGTLRDQIPFATALALTRTAATAQQEITNKLPQIFDRPTPFTMRAIAYDQATKQNLTSAVYILPQQALYLSTEIAGGVITPKKVAMPTPVDAPLTIYGGLPLRYIAQQAQRRDVFSGVVHGHPGLWLRLPHGRLIELVAWSKSWKYKPRFDFPGLAKTIINRVIDSNLRDAIAQAIRTRH